MIKILKNLRPVDWCAILICLALIVTQVWLDLKIPSYMANLTHIIERSGTSAEVMGVGAKMLLCALGSLGTAICVGYLAARTASSFSARLRALQFVKVESFSAEQISKFTTSSLITRSTNDVNQVQMIIAMGLQIIIKAPIMAIWAITKIAFSSWQWTTATAVAVIIMIILVSIVVIFVVPRFKIIQKLTDKLNGITRENLTGVRVVRAYNAEDYQQKKFEKANKELTDTTLFNNRVQAIIQPGMGLVSNGLVLSIYWIGALLVSDAVGPDRLSIFSDMIVFSAYALQVVMAFMMMSMMFIMIPRATVSANRINEVLDCKETISEGTVTEGLNDLKGEVEFRNVGFKYPGATDYVIKNVSFKAISGQTVAFIGSTGSGKSTLINLVPRFYDATEGEILVDGVNVKDYKLEALRQKLGYVPQRATMFSGTISSNVAFGDNGQPFSEELMKEAINKAQATEFVLKMPKAYDSLISRDGLNISGGQRQRLAIARAIYRQPEIFVFDDSFSALDYKTEHLLRVALEQKTAGATSLIVATRIGTILEADQIIVLDAGEVVGKGTHKELMQGCSVYQEIAQSQLSAQELSK